MRRQFATAAVTLLAVGALAAPAAAFDGPANGKENANCLGVERGERNRAGGDREKGGFGPAQSAFVRSGPTGYANYGDFLQAWRVAFCS